MKKGVSIEMENFKRLISSLLYASIFFYLAATNHLNIFYIFLSILITGSIYEVFKIHQKIKNPFLAISIIIYIIISFFLLIKIKLLELGEIKLIILITHIWASDLGGLIIGQKFGTHMLSNISPKKTWEGLIGSFIFCLILSLYLKEKINTITNLHFLLTSSIICLSSILGDLIISKIKRISKKKESGFFLPGHGGFLDRLDSMYLAAIVYYLIICM